LNSPYGEPDFEAMRERVRNYQCADRGRWCDFDHHDDRE
jgi:hypothetical protein